MESSPIYPILCTQAGGRCAPLAGRASSLAKTRTKTLGRSRPSQSLATGPLRVWLWLLLLVLLRHAHAAAPAVVTRPPTQSLPPQSEKKELDLERHDRRIAPDRSAWIHAAFGAAGPWLPCLIDRWMGVGG